MDYPTIDGHFWVVRDGEIIDWDFSDWKYMGGIYNCNNEKSYIPAPPITQKIMISMFKKVVMNRFNKPTWDETSKEFYELAETVGMTEPQPRRCFQNAVFEIQKNGGELVFGSLGFKFKDRDGYHYEYGGEHYQVVRDFIR